MNTRQFLSNKPIPASLQDNHIQAASSSSNAFASFRSSWIAMLAPSRNLRIPISPLASVHCVGL
jgi:hypothetical protein